MLNVTMLTAVGCRPCARAKELLWALQTEYPGLAVTEVDVGSEEGIELATRYHVWTLPVILVDGRVVLAGRVDDAELRWRLEGVPA